MNNIIKQLKKGAKNTHLSSAEKAEMRSALLQYVATHPVDQAVLSSRSVPSPFYTSKFRNKKTISALLIGSLLVGSSVSFAAEGSVPGDILYPVKLSVNEGVRRVVAVTPQAKAELEVKLVERRLVEVEKLAGDPDATLRAQEEAAELLKKYTHAANERFETVENDNDGDEDTHIITNLSAVLVNHERILSEIHSDIVKKHDEENNRENNGNAVQESKDNDVNERSIATSTPILDNEHSKNAEPVKSALDNVRESIKEIEIKSDEQKRKSKRTEESKSNSSRIEVKSSDNSEKLEKEESRDVVTKEQKHKEELRADNRTEEERN